MRAGRYIPARAGNTVDADETGIVSTVHPRARGELHERRLGDLNRPPGTSPPRAGNTWHN